jgi:hypothetical protein
MGTPDESGYRYRTVLWRRVPADPNDPTCVDLVFEPRVGEATLATVAGISTDAPGASGVTMRTAAGREISIFWAPFSAEGVCVGFEDGTELTGCLAAVRDGCALAVGSQRFTPRGSRNSVRSEPQTGRILALDRNARTIDVTGISGITVGDRVVVNPEGRGHNYGVTSVTPLEERAVRLELDVTSVLGRGRVAALSAESVEMDFGVMARTGNLHETRLESEPSGQWVCIQEAWNPDRDHTHMRVDRRPEGFQERDWVRIVDYVAGDPVRHEPLGATDSQGSRS